MIREKSEPGSPAGYGVSLLGVGLTTGVIQLVPGADHVANVSLLYLLVVIGTAYWFGSGPSILAGVGAVLAFDWFFVEPRYTLSINKPAEWLALAIFLLTAIVINQLTLTLRLRAEEARQRERETDALSRASWAVASQVNHQKALSEVLEQLTKVVPLEKAAIVVQSNDSLEVVASAQAAAPDQGDTLLLTREELQAVETVLNRTPPAFGAGIQLNPSGETAFLLLLMEGRVLGVLLGRKAPNAGFDKSERRMMESLANHAAVALERHRLAQEQERVGALREADRLKTALLSMVSHDFRSPLAAIKASVTGLLQDDLPWDKAAQRELLSGIDQETDRLNRMVGDVLALSRLEADAWRPQCEAVPVAEVVGAALDGLDAVQNARVAVRLASPMPEASLDSVQIVQVLHNLLENALKYSPPDAPVELCVETSGKALNFRILDRGFGLPPGEEERIFERFYRATRWRESSLPGSGIGLAICRGLVEAHGGHLRAANREGGGAVFQVSLPLEQNQSASGSV